MGYNCEKYRSLPSTFKQAARKFMPIEGQQPV
jgi:hypothetical protein